VQGFSAKKLQLKNWEFICIGFMPESYSLMKFKYNAIFNDLPALECKLALRLFWR